MISLPPKAFDRTVTFSVDGASCPKCGLAVTGAEVTAGFLAVEDGSVPGPGGRVGLKISITGARDFRLLPCGCEFDPGPKDSDRGADREEDDGLHD